MEIITLEIKYRQLASYDHLCGEYVIKKIFVGEYDNIEDAITVGNKLLNVLWKTFTPFGGKYGLYKFERFFFAGFPNRLVSGSNDDIGVSFALRIEKYENRADIAKIIETAKSAVQSLREYIKNNEEE